MNNYRPIAILPVLSRVFERLLSVKLRNYLENKKLLSCYQHGFCAVRSCQTALISLTNRLFTARGSKSYSAIATFDFSKAFDCLDHELLLSKFRSKGLSFRCISWFNSYLRERTQCVKYNKALSDPLPLASGVQEGSVCGLLLFSIFIDDLL